MSEEILENLLKQSITLSELVNSSLLILKTLEQNLDYKTALKVFLSSMDFHKNHVLITKEIISLLKEKHDNFLTKEYSEVIDKIPEFLSEKVKKCIELLISIDFIPKNLSVCPKCGRYFSEDSCKKYEVFLGEDLIGYSYKCKENLNGTNKPN